MIKSSFVISCTFILLFLTGCSVGPRYDPPVVPTPMTYSKGISATSNKHAWWRKFHDPLLNELIEQKAVCNLNIKTAVARIRAARAEYAVAYAQLFPKISADLLPPDATGIGLAQLLALSASLEPDFFGKQKENRNRANANLEAEQATHDASLLNLQAEIATTYLELREAQAKEHIFNHNIAGNRQVLAFLNSRYKSGLINYLDIAQQEALIETQLSELEINKALISAIIHKLEMLTGNNPGMLTQQLSRPKPVPQIKQAINLGIPSQLLCRRPDIIAAERRVAAAHANIRVATANLFPQITVGWLLAWQSQTIASNIMALGNPNSTFLGTFNAPILNLTLHRMVDLREREKALAVIQYEITVMRALHEVETQYKYSEHYKKSAQHLHHAVDKKQLVLKLAKNLFQKGASDFNTVLRSEEDLNRLEISYLHNLVSYQNSKINLYTALGGGIYDNDFNARKECKSCLSAPK